MESESFTSASAPDPVGAYPHARRAGDLLFLSGLGPRRKGSHQIPGTTLDAAGELLSYHIEPQVLAVFENVRRVLEEAGSRWENIVDVTVFMTDLERDFPAFNRIWAEHMAGQGKPNPTRTTIEVSALPRGGDAPIAIELKVVATVQ
jgi:2-aminomuconate deaminase